MWPQSADQIGTAMPQPGKVPTTISCRPKRGSKGQCSQFARSEQGQYLVQMASFTVNKWSNLGALEKETATHSSVLAWRILGTGEPGGLPSLGSHRVGHD